MAKPRVKAPDKVAKGEVFEIKCLLSHRMESGQRKDSDGKIIPRMIVKRFTATFNGAEVFSADWHPAISANPYMSFCMRIEESGELVLTWIDDNDEVVTQKRAISVG